MFHRARMAALGGLTAVVGLTSNVGVSSQAMAADIYDDRGPRISSPYDDPRYGDVYRHPAPPPPSYAEPRYIDPPRRHEPPRDYAYRDDDDRGPVSRDRHGYLAPINPPRPHHRPTAGDGCISHHEIRRALVNEGWRDFQDLELRGDVAKVEARRPDGRSYALKVDRCSGEIVHARPLDDQPVPYAYRDRHGGRTYR
jgi:hypothetical protein